MFSQIISIEEQKKIVKIIKFQSIIIKEIHGKYLSVK